MRRTIPILNILTVVAFQADLMITVWYATIGVTFAAFVCLIACDYRRSLSAAIVCDDKAICFHVDIDDRCQLPSSVGTRLCFLRISMITFNYHHLLGLGYDYMWILMIAVICRD